jgi:phosphatidate cytidylyltransferase
VMPEGDQGNKDELFEDLDKFFAPIQDVEWPEPEAPPAAPSATEPDDAEAGAGEAADEGRKEEVSSESTVRIPEADPGAVALGAPSSEAGPGDEDAPSDDILVRPAEESSTLPEVPSDQGGLFGRGGESEPTEGWTPEATADEGWPGEQEPSDDAEGPEPVAADERESAGVSPGGVPEVAEPSIEDVEAAADHFAESVRAETGAEDDVAVIGDPVPETVTEPMRTFDLSSLEEEEHASIGGEEDVEQSILADLDQPEVAQRTVVVGSGEGLGGPSWQEPTSVEVGGDQEDRPDTGRDVPAAFLTGLVLAAIALGSLAIGSGVFAVVASLIALVAMGELYGVMHRRHLQPATAVGLVGGALVLAGAYLHGEAAMAAMLAMTTAASFLWFMTVPQAHRKNITASVGVTVLPVVYVALLAGYALTTVRLGALLDGPRLVIDVIVLTFAYDAVAFAVGSGWGSRPLAQTISPKKSWEGSAAATVVVVGVSVVMAALFVPALDTIPRSVGLAIVVAVFAPLGDLAESLIKRDLDVKDMGSILPGHGGVLDRIDSLLFVAPAAFLYFRIFL